MHCSPRASNGCCSAIRHSKARVKCFQLTYHIAASIGYSQNATLVCIDSAHPNPYIQILHSVKYPLDAQEQCKLKSAKHALFDSALILSIQWILAVCKVCMRGSVARTAHTYLTVRSLKLMNESSCVRRVGAARGR